MGGKKSKPEEPPPPPPKTVKCIYLYNYLPYEYFIF